MIYTAYFPGLIYNSKDAIYNLTPLPDSIIQSGKIFACSKQFIQTDEHNGTLALALELSSNPSETTYYKSIERLKNLICLSYTSSPHEQRLEGKATSVDEFVSANLAERFYNPDVRYGGQLDWDLPLRVAAYSQLIMRLPQSKQKKFWQALQTYCYARQIAHLPNPQYRYTLYMSLHLASIDQLADNPKNIHTPAAKLQCPTCGELGFTHTTSHVDEIEVLIRKLVDEGYADVWVRLIRKLYHPVRSRFVHDGDLAGLEDIGGFIALWENDVELAENDINIMILNRMLLERYLQKNQPADS